MRLSRSRLALRALLLAIGGGYMVWRAIDARATARGVSGGETLLASRLAMVWALMGVLALLTAAVAALSLRRRRASRTLRLDDLRGENGRERDREPSNASTLPDHPGRPT